jgi:SAM-dependent methyltransferase
MPALLAWAAAWVVLLLLRAVVPAPLAVLAATAVALAWSLRLQGRWRQLLTGLGFPLSVWLAQGTQPLPPLAWLGALALLAVAYPLRAWRDAPFYPTREAALLGLDRWVSLPPDAAILDAGCGAGHGLRALRRVWPTARLHGVEWSRPLAWAARWRVRGARVSRGDMWAAPWGDYDLVYLFQRPESMAHAWAKACAEMKPGAWLVSLDFEVPGVAPVAELHNPGQRVARIYRPHRRITRRP